MSHSYSIKVLDKVVEFDDDIDDLSEITPFKVVMDAIPVFYAYNAYKDNGLLDEEKKNAEQISSICNVLSILYDELKEEISELRKEINSIWIKYEDWLYDCWTYLDGGKWGDGNRLDEVEVLLKNKLRECHLENDKYDIPNLIERFVKSVSETKYRLTKSMLKKRFRYWLVDKVEKYILQRKPSFVLKKYLDEKRRDNPSSKSTQQSLFFSIEGKKVFFDECINYAYTGFRSMVTSCLDGPKIKKLDVFFNRKNIPNFKIAREKYGRKGNGCFAIMINSSEQIYYALSGLQRKESDFDDICNKLEANLFPSAIRCKVSPKMLYYDWTYHNDCSAYVYKPWPFQGKRMVGDDKYTCCERKILAHDDVRDDNTFFIRWAPCVMCRPVLFNRYRKIYAFAESSEYKSVYSSTQLDEYSIGVCLGFECIKV